MPPSPLSPAARLLLTALLTASIPPCDDPNCPTCAKKGGEAEAPKPEDRPAVDNAAPEPARPDGLPTTAQPIIAYFDCEHLPRKMRTIARPMQDIANHMNQMLPDCPEKSAGMRKLLEAKDCFVRAAV